MIAHSHERNGFSRMSPITRRATQFNNITTTTTKTWRFFSMGFLFFAGIARSMASRFMGIACTKRLTGRKKGSSIQVKPNRWLNDAGDGFESNWRELLDSTIYCCFLLLLFISSKNATSLNLATESFARALSLSVDWMSIWWQDKQQRKPLKSVELFRFIRAWIALSKKERKIERSKHLLPLSNHLMN